MRRIATRWCRSRGARAETYDIPGEAIERVIVIGDTPHDIECARVAGARSIAVATGGLLDGAVEGSRRGRGAAGSVGYRARVIALLI